MYADTCHALCLGLLYHGFEVVNVRMNVTVREQAEEMKCAAGLFDVADQCAPGVGGKHFARLDGLCNQLCSLRKHLPGAECIVTHLGVAHIVV